MSFLAILIIATLLVIFWRVALLVAAIIVVAMLIAGINASMHEGMSMIAAASHS